MSSLLWQPTETQINQSNMTSFIAFVNKKYQQSNKKKSRDTFKAKSIFHQIIRPIKRIRNFTLNL